MQELLASFEGEVQRRNEEIKLLGAKNEELKEIIADMQVTQDELRTQLRVATSNRGTRDAGDETFRRMSEAQEEIEVLYACVEEEFGVKIDDLERFREWVRDVKNELKVS